MTNQEKQIENRLRKIANRQGLSVHNSRAAYSGDNLGGYRITENNGVVAGERYSLNLDDVKRFLNE